MLKRAYPSDIKCPKCKITIFPMIKNIDKDGNLKCNKCNTVLFLIDPTK